MKENLLDLDTIWQNECIDNEMDEVKEKDCTKDIAIIGMSGKFADAENINQFWQNIKMGKDSIRDFPLDRSKDVNKILKKLKMNTENVKYSQAAYLEKISEFDNEFFGISPNEAMLMDPSQRLFIETAWKAVEDSGYGGEKLRGSKTGVYLGHSDDFGVDYKTIIKLLNPAFLGESVAGNIKSIIGSRLSYVMDLKGPSILVDTACSSVLVAIHLACEGLRNGDCDMAIAGGVKVNLVPTIDNEKQNVIGIESSTGRTRAFDEFSDGTGFGEGVGAIILKPLDKAINDKDNIYAVIKGSAVNQDGNSIGITAPNEQAQTELIIDAWQNAEIDPTTISYIEAHGTGTKLGDPIEIEGIEGAFKKYTDRKQFCGIGSVKTNIGHLDNAAGIASIIKVICALKDKKLPPTINFDLPNSKINFEQSPVYVNNRLSDWKENKTARRAGISGFGLSGTNAHIIIEEAPFIERESLSEKNLNIFTLSAKSKESLIGLLNEYKKYFDMNEIDNIEDICYTANTGRGHYQYRMAVLVNSANELKEIINSIDVEKIDDSNRSNLYYSYHNVHSYSANKNTDSDISEDEKEMLTEEVNSILKSVAVTEDERSLKRICELYVKGAHVKWEKIYGHACRKVSLPTYQFQKKLHWIKEEVVDEEEVQYNKRNEKRYPLVDSCLSESVDRTTYSTEMNSESNWIISEHKVGEINVLPGTAYLEMVREIYMDKYKTSKMQFKDVVFIQPLNIYTGDTVEIQIIINNDNEFVIYSRVKDEDEWNKHVEGKVCELRGEADKEYDINSLRESFQYKKDKKSMESAHQYIKCGPRWNTIKDVYMGEDGVLACISLASEFFQDLESYDLHPALLDCAANMAIGCIGEGLYLPFFYKSLKVYKKLPAEFYSVVKRKTESRNSESVTFDIDLVDKENKVLAEIENYTIKKVENNKEYIEGSSHSKMEYYGFEWIENELDKNLEKSFNNEILVFNNSYKFGRKVVNELKNMNLVVTEIQGVKQNNEEVKFSFSKEDYKELFQKLHLKNEINIMFIANDELNNVKDLNSISDIKSDMYSLFHMIKAINELNLKNKINITLLGTNVNEVISDDMDIHPEIAALFSMGKTINNENNNIVCRSIDFDFTSDISCIVSELKADESNYQVAYRNGIRYSQILKKIYINQAVDNPIELKEEGIYVVTGGLGELGLEISKFLASKAKVNLCLINRSGLPDRSLWDELINDDSSDVCNKIRKIKKIEELGSNICVGKADVASAKEMEDLIKDLRSKYGNINGIIHCAGKAGDGFIRNKSDETFEEVIKPKIDGLCILDKLTEKDNLDFLILFSSVTAILGLPGQSDYVTANTYMDSYSEYRNKKGKRTLSINWPAWQEIGMAARYKVKDDGIFKSIAVSDAINSLDKVINKNIKNIVISRLNYEKLADSSNASFSIDLADEIKNKIMTIKNSIKRKKYSDNNTVILKGRDEKDKYTETEIKIAKIWNKVLGISEIDINKSFFELGGNSLFSIKLELEMEKNDMPIQYSDIEECRTINNLAKFIDSGNSDKMNLDEVEIKDSKLPDEDEKEIVDINMKSLEKKKVILENIKPFNEIIYKGCFYSALFSFITSNNKNILPFITNDIIVQSYSSNNQLDFNADMIEIKSMEDMLEEVGIEVKSKKYSENVVEDLIKSISNGKPVIIAIDCFYESIRKDTYNKIHWPHSILIYGYDEENNMFNVLEQSNRGALIYNKCLISYSDVENSYLGFKENFKNLDIIKSSFNNTYYNEDSENATYYELSSNVIKNDNASLEKYIKIYAQNIIDNKEKIYESLENLNKFKDSFKELILNETLFQENIEGILAILNNTISVKSIEGYRVEKLFQGETELNDLWTEVMNKWNKIRNIIGKCYYTKMYKMKSMEEIINNIDIICDLESKFYNSLISILEEIYRK